MTDALPAMTEKELSKQIVAAAKECGWLTYHTFLSKWSKPGFPDLCMVRNDRLLFWELKSAVGKVSESQAEWIEALSAVPGVDARVVRPGDLEEVYLLLIGSSLESVYTVREVKEIG